MCQELCGEDGALRARCDACDAWLCYDPDPREVRAVRTSAVVTDEDQLCIACSQAREFWKALGE